MSNLLRRKTPNLPTGGGRGLGFWRGRGLFDGKASLFISKYGSSNLTGFKNQLGLQYGMDYKLLF
ncbi:hypothetical protein ASG21_15355 [Chryseobacterium sp. Leaf394]|nr:hypothetical protein ASG21_15355 [Chryseobacterium sp. Leaf394]